MIQTRRGGSLDLLLRIENVLVSIQSNWMEKMMKRGREGRKEGRGENDEEGEEGGREERRGENDEEGERGRKEKGGRRLRLEEGVEER